MSAIKDKFDLGLPGQLWYGSSFSTIDEMNKAFQLLEQYKVTYIWNLLEDDNVANLEKQKFRVIHSPVIDFHIPKDKDLFHKDVEYIIKLLNKGKNVYVHCYGGHGRTGMAILCICVKLGRDPQESLNQTRNLIKGPETKLQIEFATGRSDLIIPKLDFENELSLSMLDEENE